MMQMPVDIRDRAVRIITDPQRAALVVGRSYPVLATTYELQIVVGGRQRRRWRLLDQRGYEGERSVFLRRAHGGIRAALDNLHEDLRNQNVLTVTVEVQVITGPAERVHRDRARLALTRIGVPVAERFTARPDPH